MLGVEARPCAPPLHHGVYASVHQAAGGAADGGGEQRRQAALAGHADAARGAEVAQAVDEMGKFAVKVLFEQIENPQTVSQIELNTKIIYGDSVAEL